MGKDNQRPLEFLAEKVFHDELEAIIERRQAIVHRPDPCRPPDAEHEEHEGHTHAPAGDEGTAKALEDARAYQLSGAAAESKPYPAARYGLVGLAISGGGIRSATFNLGIIQVFAKRGLLRWFDYLSTVSGGGYIGSALSSSLKFETEGPNKQTAAFGQSFVHTVGEDEPELLKHLRSGRNYLAPGGILDLLRIPALLLRGIILNLLVVMPFMGLLAMASAIVPPFGILDSGTEFTGFSAEQLGRGDVVLESPITFFLPTLLFATLFLTWSILFPLVAGGFRHATWDRRNKYELSFASILFAIGGVFTLNLLPFIYFVVFNGSFDTPPWRIGLAAIAAVVPVATSLRRATAQSAQLTKAVDKLKLIAAALLGPLILLSMYLGLTHLVLDPATRPFGEPSSALNVAARALRGHPEDLVDDERDANRGDLFLELHGELELEIGQIMRRDTVYSGWVSDLYGRSPALCRRGRDMLFHEFLDCALRNTVTRRDRIGEPQGLTQSLFDYQVVFQPALWLRLSPVGRALFAFRGDDNRLLEVFALDLNRDIVVDRSGRETGVRVHYECLSPSDPACLTLGNDELERPDEEELAALARVEQEAAAAGVTPRRPAWATPPPSLQRIRHLGQRSETLRKDLVIIHSAVMLLAMTIVFLYAKIFFNINKTGLHRFYRDRLSQAYLFDPRDPQNEPEETEGVEPSSPGRADRLQLSEIHPKGTGAPYHLINTALNIPATDIGDLQGRASDFFMMSPVWCGSAATGYAETKKFEGVDGWDEDLNVATAFAISGAAAAPQMGTTTSPALALMLTLLNIRLDYWIPNARTYANNEMFWRRRPGPTYLLREITGKMNVHAKYVNLSDGGHIENLGLYELLRRRCKHIVVCDAEQDPDMILSSLGKLTAYARMDDGIWIDWGNTLEGFKKDPDTGLSKRHWAFGTIHYGAAAHGHDDETDVTESGSRKLTVTGEAADPEKTGRILYIKSSWCGKEWADMAAYKAKNPDFPQQSTGDQFFDEEQFEAYRALGYLIASQLFEDDTKHVPSIEAWFDRLEKVTTPIEDACAELKTQLDKLPRVMGVERGIRNIEVDGKEMQASYIRVLALDGDPGGNVPDEWRGRAVAIEKYDDRAAMSNDAGARGVP